MARDPRFLTTRWSLVLTAKALADPTSAEALASLCEDYWYPVYAFVRRRGHGPDEATDLTQGYFATVLEKGYFRAADPARGRFRSFVLATVKQFLSHERERREALKRGGGRELIALDTAAAEERLLVDDHPDRSPERAFERAWAMTVLARARAGLEREFEAAGKAEQVRVLGPYLAGDRSGPPYSVAAAELGTSEGAVKMAVHRLRQRFGQRVREEVAGTLDETGKLEAEVSHLLAALGDG